MPPLATLVLVWLAATFVAWRVSTAEVPMPEPGPERAPEDFPKSYRLWHGAYMAAAIVVFIAMLVGPVVAATNFDALDPAARALHGVPDSSPFLFTGVFALLLPGIFTTIFVWAYLMAWVTALSPQRFQRYAALEGWLAWVAGRASREARAEARREIFANPDSVFPLSRKLWASVGPWFVGSVIITGGFGVLGFDAYLAADPAGIRHSRFLSLGEEQVPWGDVPEIVVEARQTTNSKGQNHLGWEVAAYTNRGEAVVAADGSLAAGALAEALAFVRVAETAGVPVRRVVELGAEAEIYELREELIPVAEQLFLAK